MTKHETRTDKAPLPAGPYSQAVTARGFTFISGILPIDPASGTLIAQDIEQAAQTIFKNIDAILLEAGLSRDSIVKTTLFMQDLQNFTQVNRLYADFFSKCAVLPARSTIQVAALPLDAPLEIELIASTVQ